MIKAIAVNYQLSTINYQPSTINYQLSTINRQLSTINYQLSTINCQLSTVNCQLMNASICACPKKFFPLSTTKKLFYQNFSKHLKCKSNELPAFYLP
ncbi:hypothetical protein [Microcoleus sp. CAWBG58]|uniref:hypothetical protein n=1 Tax=Microcoleus sp. CAWBG58 TaxID=2841651 RepID=UPI0025EE5DFB|nr:hypothetical protein [Microcoleus sp. CAWBG58]